jgi:hypothetical protein
LLPPERNFLSVIWNVVQMGTSIICCCAPIYQSILPKIGFYEVVRSWVSSRTHMSKQPTSGSSKRKSGGFSSSTKNSAHTYGSQPKGLNRHAHWDHFDDVSERGLAWAEIEAKPGSRSSDAASDGERIPMKGVKVRQSIDVV